MKNKVLVYMGVVLFVGVSIGYVLTQIKQSDVGSRVGNLDYGNSVKQNQNSQPNRDNCLADDCLLVDNLEYPVGKLPDEVQEALDEAINDEYKALSTYEAVIAEFGSVRPFSMIKGAEEQHIASLRAIYDKYGLEVPQNIWSANKISVPATLQEACQIGVDAEIANANLYKDKLLPSVKEYEDIVLVFTNLMDASQQKHLPAFDRCN